MFPSNNRDDYISDDCFLSCCKGWERSCLPGIYDNTWYIIITVIFLMLCDFHEYSRIVSYFSFSKFLWDGLLFPGGSYPICLLLPSPEQPYLVFNSESLCSCLHNAKQPKWRFMGLLTAACTRLLGCTTHWYCPNTFLSALFDSRPLEENTSHLSIHCLLH